MLKFVVSVVLAGASLVSATAGAQTLPVGTGALAPFKAPVGEAVCRGADGYAEAFQGRRTFLWRPGDLAAARASLTDPAVAPAFAALRAQADAALVKGPFTVVDKLKTPASGDKHDYYSIGPYWWPDPARPSREPYVRRDGQVNPERDTNAFDTADLDAMSGAVEALSLAYHFTGDRRYAHKAGVLLRIWFLDPATRMNPNFNHAKAVPGRSAGRAEGVIDAHRLVRVVESIGLLQPSGVLAPAEQDGLEAWFGDLVQWLAASPIGRAERAKTNNHGIYYDLLITHFALFAGMEDVARTVVSQAPQKRIAAQIEPDGRMPQELQRSRTFHYTNWTLTGLAELAALGECVGVDLWRYRTADGRSLRTGIDFVAAYAGRETAWPYKELNPEDTLLFHQLLRRAGRAYGDEGLLAKAATYAARNRTGRTNLGASSFNVH